MEKEHMRQRASGLEAELSNLKVPFKLVFRISPRLCMAAGAKGVRANKRVTASHIRECKCRCSNTVYAIVVTALFVLVSLHDSSIASSAAHISAIEGR
jgi:hypothetical protein